MAVGPVAAAARERLNDALAWAAALPILLLPVSNPDLFWHLSTASRIVSHGSLPRDDYLSFTRLGAPWVDFEWLVQLIFFGFHEPLGWAGLWALKILLLLVAAAAVWALAGLHAGGLARRLCLLFWAALSLPRAELKPELFSVILFSVELWALEAHRLGALRLPEPGWTALLSLAFFAFWANLHPGFPMGLALIAAYAAGRDRESLLRLGPAFACGLAGTLLNPYGTGLYVVLADHARWFGVLSRRILEWTPPQLSNPMVWPLAALAAAVLAAWLLRWRAAGRPPAPHLLCAVVLGLQGLAVSRRQGAYFVPVGLLCLMESYARLKEAGLPALRPGLRRGLAAAACALYAVYVGALALPRLQAPRAADYDYMPAAAADFIGRNLDVLGHRRIFNEWGWGGYLSYRFEPDIRVFMDGRYLFHPLLAEADAAQADPVKWQGLLDKYGVEWALIGNFNQPVTVVELLGGGRVRRTRPPHLSVYMPANRWALVHQDPLALIYARRGTLPEAWLARHEVRYEWRRP